MEEKELLCAIPRNLNKSDTIIHSPVKLNWKQIAYIGVGVISGYAIFQTGLPYTYKIILTTSSIVISTIASLIRYQDSTIDELAVDSLYYVQRKNIYKQIEKRGDLVVNINSKKEETTTTRETSTTFTISAP